jgi:hypothetical protein
MFIVLIIIKIKIFITQIKLFLNLIILIIIKIKIFKIFHRDSIQLGHARPIDLGIAALKPNSLRSVLRMPPKTLWVLAHLQVGVFTVQFL